MFIAGFTTNPPIIKKDFLIYFEFQLPILDEILAVESLKKYFVKKGIFSSSERITRAVDGISFSIKQGDVLVLAGESGSGKSTIASLILGAINPDSGKIFFDGSRVDNDKKKMESIRLQCQMIHQDPYGSIDPRMRISEIIMEPLEIHNISTKEERKKMVLNVIREVKLEPAEEIFDKFPHMLSGGQRQRVVLARALVLKPKLIIADEPVSMLDVSNRAEVLELMQDLQEKYNIAYLYITHDLATARYLGKMIVIMLFGKIMEMGPIEEILNHPFHPYTQALLDAISEPNPENLKSEKKIRINESKSLLDHNGCRFLDRCPYAIEKCKEEPLLEQIGKDRFVACFAKLS